VTSGPTGVVYDLGYQPHEGPRLGRRGAVAAVVRDGVRRVLGLRRKARRKVLPWGLVTLAVLPAVVLVGLAFLLDSFVPGDVDIFSHAQYFELSGTATLLFIALAAPELLVPDRQEGVLSVYASRPLRAADYLGARAGALAVVVLGFLLLPQLLLYFGLAAVSPDGFVSALTGNLSELPRIAAASVVYFVGLAAPGFLVAIYATRTAVASGIYLLVMTASNGIAEGLTQATDLPGHRYGALLALPDHTDAIRNWIFDFNSRTVPGDAGFDAWVSFLVVAFIAVAATYLALRRYRSEL
jgi:ABC-2 type transport system permease protein